MKALFSVFYRGKIISEALRRKENGGVRTKQYKRFVILRK